MKHQACVIVIAALMSFGFGCGRVAPAPSVVYDLRGVVRAVDPASGLTISHEEIVGFMPKMTMPFKVKNRRLLEGVKAGDTVAGKLKVDRSGDAVQTLEIIDLVVEARGEVAPSTVEPPVQAASPALEPGDPVPDFVVTTQDGKPLNLAELRGKVVVLSFIYTRCPSPEFCPAMDLKFAALARQIGLVADRADQVRLLSVSFDPEYDTPEILRAHAGRRGARPPLWTFAVASHEQLSKIAGPLGLTYAPGTTEINHNLRAAVIGPDGRLAAVYVGDRWTPAEVMTKVNGLLMNAGK